MEKLFISHLCFLYIEYNANGGQNTKFFMNVITFLTLRNYNEIHCYFTHYLRKK